MTNDNSIRKPRTTGMDAIVVLGAAVMAGGRPSVALRRRVLHAAGLYRSGVAKVVIVSGGHGGNVPSEARVMKRLAVEHGVPENRIIMEETAQNTVGNAIACARILKQKNWSNVMIVSDRFHLPRGRLLFRLLGINAAGSGPEVSNKVMRRRKWLYFQLREIVAIPVGIMTLLWRRTKSAQTARNPSDGIDNRRTSA
jgi:uncharacterized SAM-binding protein YcdF (DUF218 family)